MSNLEQLAATIAQNASTIARFLLENGHSEFSFDHDSPARFPGNANHEILTARHDLVWAAKQIQYLALGPNESLQMLPLTGVSLTLAIVVTFQQQNTMFGGGIASLPDLQNVQWVCSYQK